MKSEANPQQTGHACASDQCQHQLSIPIDCTGAPAHDCADGPGYSLAIRDSRGPLNGHPSLRHGVARPRAAWRCLMLVATTQWLSRGECWELAGPLNSRVEQTPTRICQSHTNLEQHRQASNRSRAMSSSSRLPAQQLPSNTSSADSAWTRCSAAPNKTPHWSGLFSGGTMMPRIRGTHPPAKRGT